MRIEAYNQIAQIYQNNKASKVKGMQNVEKRDEVQISQAGRDYQVAKQAVAEASDIRENKAAQLKADIKAGNYKVEIGDFAAKLIQNYNQYL